MAYLPGPGAERSQYHSVAIASVPGIDLAHPSHVLAPGSLAGLRSGRVASLSEVAFPRHTCIATHDERRQ
jgi:hypothetical protein